MARYSEYLGSDYLPGEVYSAGLSDYRLDPAFKTKYMSKKRFKFTPETDVGNLFQTFLNLQANPEALFSSTAKMPSEPFNISQYTAMGI